MRFKADVGENNVGLCEIEPRPPDGMSIASIQRGFPHQR